MKTPKNQISEILFYLVQKPKINHVQLITLTGALSVTCSITNLRKLGVIIDTETIHTKNKFGRPIHYVNWIVKNKTFAKELYKEINK
jgi:hypothetical protein